MNAYFFLGAAAVVIAGLAAVLVIVTVTNIVKVGTDENRAFPDIDDDEEKNSGRLIFEDLSEKDNPVYIPRNDYEDDIKTSGVDYISNYKKNSSIKHTVVNESNGSDEFNEKRENFGRESVSHDMQKAQDLKRSSRTSVYDDEFETVSFDNVPEKQHGFLEKTMSIPVSRLRVTLKYKDGHQNKIQRMSSDVLTVGRGETNDFIVSENSYMSREHAIFTINGDRLFLRDLNSKNGTFINGKRITEENEIYENCTVKFGNIVVEVQIEKE